MGMIACQSQGKESEQSGTNHAAGVRGRVPVDNGTPYVEVFASATVVVSTTSVTQVRTGLNVVFIKESEAHILMGGQHDYVLSIIMRGTYTWGVVCAVGWPKDVFVSFRCVGIG